MKDPEARILLDLLAGRKPPIEVLDEPGWSRVLQLAKDHGVSSVLPECLKAQGITPPGSIGSRIKAIQLARLLGNARIFHQLGVVLKEFGKAGIGVVPFKGAWLAEAVYTNIAQRPMVDIDLWVHSKQFDDACKVLESLGYAAGLDPDRPRLLQDAVLGEVAFHRRGAVPVDLHRSIMPGEWLRRTTRVDQDEMWQRAVRAGPETPRYLRTEDAIIQLCVHLAVTHRMAASTLRTLVDLDRVRRRYRVDWGAVASSAREWRLATVVWLVLRQLDSMFGDDAKELPLALLAPSPVRRVILGRFVDPEKIMERLQPITGFRSLALLLTLVDRFRDAAGLIRQAVLPDREWLTARYGLRGAPSWRIALQRLWHPVRAVIKRGL